MRDGKLLAMGTPLNLKKQVITGNVWEVFGEPLEDAVMALHKVQGVLRAGLNGDHIRIISEKGLNRDELYKSLRVAGINITSLILGEPTLEDVFLSLAR
jgi:ABC-type multidrug transport system ATPase subunit